MGSERSRPHNQGRQLRASAFAAQRYVPASPRSPSEPPSVSSSVFYSPVPTADRRWCRFRWRWTGSTGASSKPPIAATTPGSTAIYPGLLDIPIADPSAPAAPGAITIDYRLPDSLQTTSASIAVTAPDNTQAQTLARQAADKLVEHTTDVNEAACQRARAAIQDRVDNADNRAQYSIKAALETLRSDQQELIDSKAGEAKSAPGHGRHLGHRDRAGRMGTGGQLRPGRAEPARRQPQRQAAQPRHPGRPPPGAGGR